MKALVSIHEDFPPFRQLADLPTAHAINRLYTLSGRGACSFSIATNDPGARRDTIREGRLVVIWSTTALPPYIGHITKMDEKPTTEVIDVTGDNLAAMLYERQLPLDCSFTTQAAGGIAMQLLRIVNSTNPTGIWPSPKTEPGTPIEGAFAAGSMTLGDALDQLATLTMDEWWIECVVTRAKIERYLRWGNRRGTDKSASIWLREGVHVASVEYSRDAGGYAQSVASVGGGSAVADRPAAVQTFNQPSGAAAKGSVVGAASTALTRSRAITGPALAREVVEILPLDEEEAVLAGAAAKRMTRPIMEAESFKLTINSVQPWSSITPGDYVQLVLYSAYFSGVSRRVRVLAMQPDEDTGEMDLAVQVEV